MNACAGPFKYAFLTRVLLLAVVMMPVACTRDDTAVDSREQSAVPGPAPPVAAPEWYPTPKRAGSPSFRINTPAAGGTGYGSRQSAGQAADRQSPAFAGGTTRAQTWSSAQDQANQREYSPWTSQQPADRNRMADTQEQQGEYRPWGAYNPSQSKKPESPNVWQFPTGQPGRDGDGARQGYPPPVPAYSNGMPQYVW